MREVLVAALVLACPLMMIWMMRGHGNGHGHGAGDHDGGRRQGRGTASTDELRRRRDELDRTIAERERSGRDEQHERDPVAPRLTGSEQSRKPGMEQPPTPIAQAIIPEAASERRQARAG